MSQFLHKLIFIIGAVQILKYVANLIWQIVKELIPLGSSLDRYGRKDGCWAVVTGGTDGIGLGFCEVLSEMGWNVCIISRNQQKIKTTIQNITAKLTSSKKDVPKFKYVVFDFKNSGDVNLIQSIATQLSGIKIGILVNNVGTGGITNYQDFKLNQIIDLIHINCTSMAALTSALLPKLKLHRSAIINLSSFLGQNPTPYSTLYSATKAFNTYFSESLSMQDKLKNIDILSVKPMFVQSPLSRQKKGFTVPDRRQCALACLKQLRWQQQTNGNFIHRLLALLTRLFPRWLKKEVTKFSAKKHLLNYHKNI